MPRLKQSAANLDSSVYEEGTKGHSVLFWNRILYHNMVMIKVNVFEIKAKLAEYLDRAANGDRIVIYRHSKPVAELRAVEEGLNGPRPVGPLPGRPVFKVPASFFDELQSEELEMWEGKTPPRISAGGKSSRARKAGRKRRPLQSKSR